MGIWHMLLILVLLCGAAATDTLSTGEYIKDGETLVSVNGTFELGFFSPGHSDNRYVAIWYRGLVPLTTIWVANRNHPVRTTTGSFGVDAVDGNVVVLDDRRAVVWSSNTSSTTANTSLTLLNSGNLVLHQGGGDDNGATRWQSFDNPTDTFLPGMKIAAGQGQLFTSWRSVDDPGTGNFSIGLDPRGSAQIYLWEGSSPRWRSGQWNGQAFIGTRMRSLYLYGFKLTTDDVGNRRYFTFSTFNVSLYRFTLQPDGVENATILVNSTKQWSEIWAEPAVECEVYNHCGSNEVCYVDSGTARCSCLVGYEKSSAGGEACVKRSRWKCEGGADVDVFVKVGGLKLPDFAEWESTIMDDGSCRELCAGNCTCRAYAFVEGIGCMYWTTDLVDIYQSYGMNTYDLYLKVAASDAEGTNRQSRGRVIVIATISTASTLFLFLFTSLLLRKWRSRMQEFMKIGRKATRRKKPFASISDLELESHDLVRESKSSDLPIYPLDTIAAATQYFSLGCRLGRGGFGDVYKGVFPWGQEVAVKRLSKNSGQGLEEFKNEAILISKLQHRNLVRVLGCCVEKEEKILIYEYMPNKSLDVFLFDESGRSSLDWGRRFSIIEGIARGLLYLHRDSRLRIVHRDLKASNILLDQEMSPKISDFGMARIFGSDQNQGNTNRVVGTFGYMSPEYAMEGLFSVKSDVYSFGVLILEIVSGRKNSSFSNNIDHGTNLVGHAWRLWNSDRALELADPAMGDSIIPHQVLRCVHVGLLCIQDKVADRPIMSSVVLMLGSESAILGTPRQPTYTLERGPSDQDSSLTVEENLPSNDLTMTSLHER